MTTENFEKTLQAFIRRRPFKSFMVELMSGGSIVVDHPEALALRGSVGVFISPKGDYTFLDSTSVSRMTEDLESSSSR
jgi:hypothetical protein